jgi:hypothetical protein
MNEPEIALYEQNLCGHLAQMVYRLRQMSAEQIDYRPAVSAPTARILATHALQWLICDRQHIEEPDAARHARIPAAPEDPAALCDALTVEIENWRAMLRAMTPERLELPRSQFNQHPMTVRDFVGHMLQNCIYKNGQLATLYFALGLDGTEPYDAPFPNPIYDELFGPAATACDAE